MVWEEHIDEERRVSIPQAVWIACNRKNSSEEDNEDWFQYRKRYGLHAMLEDEEEEEDRYVSIPQAVWIACNPFV